MGGDLHKLSVVKGGLRGMPPTLFIQFEPHLELHVVLKFLGKLECYVVKVPLIEGEGGGGRGSYITEYCLGGSRGITAALLMQFRS